MDEIWEHIDRASVVLASFKLSIDPPDCDDDCDNCEDNEDGICMLSGFDITDEDLRSMDICIKALIDKLEERL